MENKPQNSIALTTMNIHDVNIEYDRPRSHISDYSVAYSATWPGSLNNSVNCK